MSEFSAEWLKWREPVDHAARSDEVLDTIARYFSEFSHLKIIDIGSGTGSTVRAMEPAISQSISWILMDHDAALLSYAKESLGKDDVRFEMADLSQSIDSIFSFSPDLITTSAFLDLVSRPWLEALISEITRRRIPFYAALTYDGKSGCLPNHEADASILKYFNKHQHGDKGFGPALGPDAADVTLRLFDKAGYKIVSKKSNWNAEKNHFKFQQALVEGWHKAACEIAPDKREWFDQWLAFRTKQISQNSHSVFVGHMDFFATPTI